MFVASVLLEYHQHLSADDVLKRLRDRGDPVSKATVYNSLSLFVERGLIKAISVDSSRTFYDSNAKKHSHFYNIDSGELIDIDNESQVVIENLPQLPFGTELEDLELMVKIKNKVKR